MSKSQEVKSIDPARVATEKLTKLKARHVTAVNEKQYLDVQAEVLFMIAEQLIELNNKLTPA